MQNLAEKITVKLIKIKKMPGVDTSVGNVAGSFGTLHFGLPKITVSDRGLAFGFTPDAGSMSVLGLGCVNPHVGDGIVSAQTSALIGAKTGFATAI